jgi:hypothetical protein
MHDVQSQTNNRGFAKRFSVSPHYSMQGSVLGNKQLCDIGVSFMTIAFEIVLTISQILFAAPSPCILGGGRNIDYLGKQASHLPFFDAI